MKIEVVELLLALDNKRKQVAKLNEEISRIETTLVAWAKESKEDKRQKRLFKD